ncbi:MAG: Winged helix DNA-binding domain, partial [Gaiellaceae bacterium]|nr:Winged helix DNA-binding domain [Gaiellaceae bacterium]
ERVEGLGAHEPLRAGCDERDHLVAVLDEQPRQLARLVRRDSSSDPEQNPAHTRIVPVRTLEEAAAWVDRVGLALVFPKDDLVLPSLWHAAGGVGGEFAEREPDGTFVRWAAPMDFVWHAKDELVEAGLVCGGKHLRGRASLVSLGVLPALVATAAERELPELEAEIVEVLREHGPLTTRELPELLPHRERKRVRAAVDRLQGRMLLTSAGREESTTWPALIVDLVARRHAERLREPPSVDEARRILLEKLLAAAGELSVADVTGALGWRRADARAALESLREPTYEEAGVPIWTR